MYMYTVEVLLGLKLFSFEKKKRDKGSSKRTLRARPLLI